MFDSFNSSQSFPPAQTPYATGDTKYVSRVTSSISRLIARRPLMLSLISLVSLCVYFAGLLLPYNLFTLGLTPLLNIAKLTRGDPVAQVRLVITFAALSGLYYLAWKLCRNVQSRRMWVVLLAGALTINTAMLFLYPIDAADIFDNIIRGRITAAHGGNPFYDTPIQFRSDPLVYYAAWRESTSAYGPLWELLAAAASRIVGEGKLINVLGFKIVGVVFYFGCIVLIAAILKRVAPERALKGVCLFALNPLVIYATAGNGHNDIVMVFFILLAMYAATRNWFAFAAVAVTAGALVKFIPLLLLPIILTAGLRARPDLRARVRYLIVTLLACTALVIVTYAPFWKGGDPLAIQQREGLFTSSLPAVLQAQLESSMGVDASRRVTTIAALILTGGVVLAAVWRVWVETATPSLPSPIAELRDGGGVGVWRASAFVLLFYLLFTCLWFQPWYAIWPLALAALLPEGESGRIAVLLSYAAVWKTIIFDFFLVTGAPLPPRIWRETLLGPATLGVAWLYGAYALAKRISLISRISLTLRRRYGR